MPTSDDITEQQTRLVTYRRSLAHYLQQQARLGEAYAPPTVSHGIYEARSNIQRIKEVLRSWNVEVDDHPDDGSDTPRASAAPPVPKASTNIDRTRMRQILIDYFNEEELRDLTFDVNIDYDSLSGSNKASKARELIQYMENRGRYAELVREVQRLRPQLA